MKKNLFKILVVSCVTALLFIGCGTRNDKATNKVIEETVTVTDAKGEVKIPKNPQRIVDLSGNSDILSILGYKVIGTANSDAYDYTKLPTYLENTLSGENNIKVLRVKDKKLIINITSKFSIPK